MSTGPSNSPINPALSGFAADANKMGGTFGFGSAAVASGKVVGYNPENSADAGAAVSITTSRNGVAPHGVATIPQTAKAAPRVVLLAPNKISVPPLGQAKAKPRKPSHEANELLRKEEAAFAAAKQNIAKIKTAERTGERFEAAFKDAQDVVETAQTEFDRTNAIAVTAIATAAAAEAAATTAGLAAQPIRETNATIQASAIEASQPGEETQTGNRVTQFWKFVVERGMSAAKRFVNGNTSAALISNAAQATDVQERARQAVVAKGEAIAARDDAKAKLDVAIQARETVEAAKNEAGLTVTRLKNAVAQTALTEIRGLIENRVTLEVKESKAADERAQPSKLGSGAVFVASLVPAVAAGGATFAFSKYAPSFLQTDNMLNISGILITTSFVGLAYPSLLPASFTQGWKKLGHAVAAVAITGVVGLASSAVSPGLSQIGYQTAERFELSSAVLDNDNCQTTLRSARLAASKDAKNVTAQNKAIELQKTCKGLYEQATIASNEISAAGLMLIESAGAAGLLLGGIAAKSATRGRRERKAADRQKWAEIHSLQGLRNAAKAATSDILARYPGAPSLNNQQREEVAGDVAFKVAERTNLQSPTLA